MKCIDSSIEGNGATCWADYKAFLSRLESISHGTRETVGEDYAGLALSLYDLGHYKLALAVLNRALDALEGSNQKKKEAECRHHIGAALYQLGHPRPAVRFLRESLQIFSEIGDKNGQIMCCSDLCQAHYTLADFRQADQFCKRIREIRDDAPVRFEP